MVEHTAHNGESIGSTPVTLNIFNFSLKVFKLNNKNIFLKITYKILCYYKLHKK